MMTLPQWTGLAGIGALVAVFSGAWSYVRTGIAWARDLVICRAVIKHEAADAVMAMCWSSGRRSPFGLRMFGSVSSWVQPASRVQVVAYESMSSDPVLFWFGKVPLVIGRRPDNDRLNVGDHDQRNTIYITFIRGSVNVDKFIIEAIGLYNHTRQGTNGQTKRNRFHIARMGGNLLSREDRKSPGHDSPAIASGDQSGRGDFVEGLMQKTLRLLEWKPAELIAQTPNQSPFHGFMFPVPIMEAMNEMKLWLDNEKWFRSKSVPWRRGWLLHGPPGTGKSTLVRAMAMHFDMPVFTFDLSTHDNNSFTGAWAQVSGSAPSIALIEDIDTVFEGRTNVAATNKHRDNLTFDCLLNCISGVGNAEGVFLVVTTNHPETLDPALGAVKNGISSRPGRIDRVIKLGYMEPAERQRLAEHILSDFPDAIAGAVLAGAGMTPAQFQDLCAQEALGLFWEKQLKAKVA